MAFDAHSNLVITTVATGPVPPAAGGSLIVAAGDGALFPATPFNCTVWPANTQARLSNTEIVRVTAIVGDTLTITRAQEGTSAQPIVAGYQIALTITAKTLQDIEAAIGGGGLTAFNISAGTTSNNLSAVTFSNANGVSFGLNAGVLTGTVATNYQSQGAYLTTAALSGDTSKYAGIGFTSASTAGTAVVATLATNGLSMGIPAYITTAQPVGAYLTTAALSQDSSKYAGTNTSVATTAGTDITLGVNTSGVTIGYPKWITTYVNDLTSQRAGTNTSVATTAGTDLTLGVNTSGVTIGYPKWITTYVNDLTSQRAGTNTSVQTTSGTDLSFVLNTSGLTIAYPAWITTAAATNITSARAGTNASVATTAGTDLTLGVNTNGVSIGYPAWITTADLSANSSKYAGTGFTTASTAGAVLVGTLNTSGLSMGVPAWLTTAPASHATVSYWANLQLLGGTTTVGALSNTLYVQPLSIPNYVSASYLRILASMVFTSTTIATSAVNNASGASTAFSETVNWNAVLYSAGAGTNSRFLQYVTSGAASWTWAASVSQASTSNATNQSFTQRMTYPNEGNNTDSISTQYSVSATNGPISTTQWSNFSGSRYLDIPFATLISPGVYWLALNRVSGTVGGKNMDIGAAWHGVSQTNVTFANMNAASNASNVGPQFALGSISIAAATFSSSLSMVNISAAANNPIVFVQFARQA